MPLRAAFPPGPSGHWLLGCVPAFRRDLLGFVTACARTHGDVASFRLGPRRHVLVSHPDLVHRILVTDNQYFLRPYNYQYLRPFVGNGLLLNEGKDWLRQRRLIQPHFLRRQLAAYVAPMTEITQRFLGEWQPGQTRDLFADMMRVTLEIISRVILGIDVKEEARLVEATLEVLMADYKRRFESGISLPRWLPTPGNWRLNRSLRDLDGLITRLIAQRRSAGGARADLLSQLLHARDGDNTGMSEQQLRDEMVMMLLAGHETTANTLTWTLYLLAQHPDIEAAVVRELADVLGGQHPSAADLEKLPLTERVLLESMRLYPTAYMLGRKSTKQMEIGGYSFPAGTTFLMSQWVLHRDPRFWDHADEFRPQRWESGARALPERAYFPFGAGPRLCVGNNFGEMEATLILALLLPRFRLQCDASKSVVPWPSVTLRPQDGLEVTIRMR